MHKIRILFTAMYCSLTALWFYDSYTTYQYFANTKKLYDGPSGNNFTLSLLLLICMLSFLHFGLLFFEKKWSQFSLALFIIAVFITLTNFLFLFLAFMSIQGAKVDGLLPQDMNITTSLWKTGWDWKAIFALVGSILLLGLDFFHEKNKKLNASRL